jgi:hypothetical protein
MLRPGNAGTNTAADHITVLGQARQQIPDACRYGSPILIRSDSAGSSDEFLAHIRGLRDHGIDTGSPSGSRSPHRSGPRSPPPPIGCRR